LRIVIRYGGFWLVDRAAMVAALVVMGVETAAALVECCCLPRVRDSLRNVALFFCQTYFLL